MQVLVEGRASGMSSDKKQTNRQAAAVVLCGVQGWFLMNATRHPDNTQVLLLTCVYPGLRTRALQTHGALRACSLLFWLHHRKLS